MEKLHQIKLFHLVMAYIALIAVYIVVPHSLDTLRRTLSITALAFLALILVKSIDFLRQS